MPVVMTHLLRSRSILLEVLLPPRHLPFDHFRFRLAYPRRSFIPTSLLHRRAASDGSTGLPPVTIPRLRVLI